MTQGNSKRMFWPPTCQLPLRARGLSGPAAAASWQVRHCCLLPAACCQLV